ncbi:hypothetical protein ABG79_00217 [Caloramator mitchellensis]|uniref:Uncharacterized protein n=1 Tax=Caloramator mitchellensis TaxID=908809 RepID=A0A0R3K537_CALMK|nr:hypothetical protein [Caloramator mitchellensis]KRQ88050.1 hypothetical protein ABG79_00217 [Caloramator mitchellensis]
MANVPDDYEEPPLNSTELIEKDFNDGKISLEKASLFKIFADYDEKRLPDKYKSNQPADTCEYAIRYLADNWDNISQ